MSMTLAQADTFIAKIIGGQNDTTKKTYARHALGEAMEDLQTRNDWSFLVVDTGRTFAVASCIIDANGTSVTVSANGFQNVLKGMTVTGTGVPAGTTVSVVTSTTAITLSQASTPATVTLTFGGTIPIIAGTDQYTLPSLFYKPLSCRLISATQKLLKYVTPRELDMVTYDPTTQGDVSYYTLYNGASFDASGTQQGKIKFFHVPAQADVALLKYYRPFNVAADPVDIPDEYLYTLLLLARKFLLLGENANDERYSAVSALAESRVRAMIGKDRNEGGEDEFERLHTPGEVLAPRGDSFWPRGDYGAGMPDGIF